MLPRPSSTRTQTSIEPCALEAATLRCRWDSLSRYAESGILWILASQPKPVCLVTRSPTAISKHALERSYIAATDAPGSDTSNSAFAAHTTGHGTSNHYHFHSTTTPATTTSISLPPSQPCHVIFPYSFASLFPDHSTPHQPTTPHTKHSTHSDNVEARQPTLRQQPFTWPPTVPPDSTHRLEPGTQCSRYGSSPSPSFLPAPTRPRGVCVEIAQRRSLHGTHSHKEYSRKRTDVHAPQEHAREEPVHRWPGTSSSWTDWTTRAIEKGPSLRIHAALGRQHHQPSSIGTTTPNQGTTTAPDPPASGPASKTDWEASNTWHPPHTREATSPPLQNFQSPSTLCTIPLRPTTARNLPHHHHQTTFQRHPHHHRNSIPYHQHQRHQQRNRPCEPRKPQQNPHPGNGKHPPSKHHHHNPDFPSPSDPDMQTHQHPFQRHLPAHRPRPARDPQMAPTPPPLQHHRSLFTFNTQNWPQFSNPQNPWLQPYSPRPTVPPKPKSGLPNTTARNSLSMHARSPPFSPRSPSETSPTLQRQQSASACQWPEPPRWPTRHSHSSAQRPVI